uniref:Platelet glycoprotein IX n=1 Tax=Callorhinchus milii TaxID=7868 RepID=A0A4W3I7P3_CALMI
MLACIGAPLILLLTLPVGGVPCPDPCHCTPLSPGGLKVDCSRLGLREVPALPENTSELYLQSNRLTAVAPGTFDKPRDLRRVELSNNPWVCDCQIAYLRQWLRGQELRMERKIRCSSPASAKGKRGTGRKGKGVSLSLPVSWTTIPLIKLVTRSLAVYGKLLCANWLPLYKSTVCIACEALWDILLT